MEALTSYTLIHLLYEVSLHCFEHIDGNVFVGLANVVQLLQGPWFVIVNNGFEISP